MPLSAAERAEHYREKNKDGVRNKDNLCKNVHCLTMKVMDPIKNAYGLKNKRVDKAAYRKKKREKMNRQYHNHHPSPQRGLHNIQS